MKKVKGSILIDFVKTVRADKTGIYDKYFTDEDKKVISQRILPSAWYPYETYKHLLSAVFEVLAKGDPEVVRNWGKLYGKAIITSTYKTLIKEGEPLEYLRKYQVYIKNFFDFAELEVKPVGHTKAEVAIKGFEPDFLAHYYIMRGWLEVALELCGARNIKVETISDSRLGATEMRICLSWEI